MRIVLAQRLDDVDLLIIDGASPDDGAEEVVTCRAGERVRVSIQTRRARVVMQRGIWAIRRHAGFGRRSWKRMTSGITGTLGNSVPLRLCRIRRSFPRSVCLAVCLSRKCWIKRSVMGSMFRPLVWRWNRRLRGRDDARSILG
jgi:hypothetical protein